MLPRQASLKTLGKISQSLPFWVLLVGAALSLAAFKMLRDAESDRLTLEFKRGADAVGRLVERTLVEQEAVLHTLRILFNNSAGVSRQQFSDAATELINRHVGVQSLEWVPRVKASERAEYEQRAREAGLTDFQFTERASLTEVRRAADASEYFPVYYLEPYAPNKRALGFNLRTGITWPALLDAAEKDTLTASGRVPLLDNRSHPSYGYIMQIPVYEKTGLTNPVDRINGLRGYILAVFRIEDILDDLLDRQGQPGFDVLFLDQSAQPSAKFLHYYPSRLDPDRSSKATSAEQFTNGLYQQIQITLAARTWNLLIRPSPKWIKMQPRGYAPIVLIASLLFSGMLAGYMHNLAQRTRVIKHEVTERTAELTAAKLELEKDIQRRTEVESALHASDERYRSFVAHSSEGIYRLEFTAPLSTKFPVQKQIEHIFDYAVVAECNDSLAYRYGYGKASDFVGTRLDQVLNRHSPNAIDFYRSFVTNGFRLVELETSEIDNHGKQRFFVHNLVGLLHDGQVVRAWGTQREITERKLSELRLQESEARLQAILDASPLVVFLKDLEGRYLLINRQFEKTIRMSRDQVIGRNDVELYGTHKAKSYQKSDLQIISLGLPLNFEDSVITGDEQKVFLVHKFPLRDISGHIYAICGLGTDLTEQKRAAEEKNSMEIRLRETQRLESLGVLAGGIAHDFNNLLTAILGNATLARLDMLPGSRAHASLDAIEQTALNAAGLCQQMLAYSGKGRFSIQQIDLGALISETTKLLHVSISKKAVLNLELGQNLPTVLADATQIRQIIMNLVINASDAIGDNPGRINLTTGLIRPIDDFFEKFPLVPDKSSDAYVFIQIADSGCGMSTETMARIFDPFFTTKFSGRGLGLAATLGILRGHHGAINVVSNLGEGTTFTIYLPAAGPSTLPMSGISTDLAPRWQGKGTLLIIDDEEAVRLVASRLVEKFGFTALTAADGEKGVSLLKQHGEAITAAMLDLTMPGLSGRETLEALRTINPNLRILIMSGYSQDTSIEERSNQLFVQKPFTMETLRTRLRALFEPELSS
ncbi:MAG TPA: CHASE domain-containing protein [Opitutaceae bacterium]|nr:CHASE domain-containing protein [Opitutaceae bacterium]